MRSVAFLTSLVIGIGLILAPTSTVANTPWSLELEAALVQALQNDVRIPGDTGTEFSLIDDLDTIEEVAFRARLGRSFGERYHVSVLVAPLRIRSSGSLAKPIEFNGETFAAGDDLDGTYQFNSYRATWRYRVIHRRNLIASLGITAMVRDAFVELSGNATTTRKDDLGVIPLANLRLDWRWGPTLGVLVDGDAVATRHGHAEDGLIALVVRPYSRGSLRLGYRVLAGGVDHDTVYNMARIEYYTFGWHLRF